MRIATCCSVVLLALLALPLHAGPRAMATDDFIASLAAASPAGTGQPAPADLSTDRRGTASRATCIADCGGGTTVSCSYTPPATCVAVDRNCPSTAGYVSCNGATTPCPSTCGTPPECTEGAIQWYPTGSCCGFKREDMDKYQCIGGTWQYVTTQCRISTTCFEVN
jgi:hypothetical protein